MLGFGSFSGTEAGKGWPFGKYVGCFVVIYALFLWRTKEMETKLNNFHCTAQFRNYTANR